MYNICIILHNNRRRPADEKVYKMSDKSWAIYSELMHGCTYIPKRLTIIYRGSFDLFTGFLHHGWWSLCLSRSITIFIVLYHGIMLTMYIGINRAAGSAGTAMLDEDQESRRASSRGIIPRAKIKTVKMTFVIVFGKLFVFLYKLFEKIHLSVKTNKQTKETSFDYIILCIKEPIGTIVENIRDVIHQVNFVSLINSRQFQKCGWAVRSSNRIIGPTVYFQVIICKYFSFWGTFYFFQTRCVRQTWLPNITETYYIKWFTSFFFCCCCCCCCYDSNSSKGIAQYNFWEMKYYYY